MHRRKNADIQRLASELLHQYGRQREAPVDVDSLAEYDLHIRIETRAGLHAGCGVKSVISQDLSTIYVDDRLFSDEVAWRHAIAVQVAHSVLHADVIRSLPSCDDRAWLDALLALPAQTSDALAKEAEEFAKALLVPEEPLMAAYVESVKKLDAAGQTVGGLTTAGKEAFAGRIARQFLVPTWFVVHRLASFGVEGW